MATRSERLNRLEVKSPCPASWDEMAGDERQRFCSRCHRDVLDFARMTEPEILARLEASRGRLCARITESGGKLTTAPLVQPASFAVPRRELRVSPLAATFVTAILATGLASVCAETRSDGGAGLAVAEPRPGSEEKGRGQGRKTVTPSPAAGAILRGRVLDDVGNVLPGATVTTTSALDGRESIARSGEDGTFAFPDLLAGIYDLRAELEGYLMVIMGDLSLPAGETRSVEIPLPPSVQEATGMTGALAVVADPVWKQYQESELVVAARVGNSRTLSRDGDVAEVETELLVDSTFKGRVVGRSVAYRHAETILPGAAGVAEVGGDLFPGARILAFLEPDAESEPSGRPIYRAASYGFGLRVLGVAEREAVLGRIEALARLLRGDGDSGVDPADLMEWLVATAAPE